ncbi:hypothetical protein HK104_007133 [Borealophlyctis nickersoniae]|nr:hypothetical protein HK104_007133 [Borealophlyctis nickersoniae]
MDTYRRCVAGCPNVTADPTSEGTESLSVVCQYDVVPGVTRAEVAAQVLDGVCAYTLDSRSILNRCVPDLLLKFADEAVSKVKYNDSTAPPPGTQGWGDTLSSDFNARSVGEMIFQDFYSAWWIILACCGISFVFSFLWFIFLQYFAGPIVYLTIILLLGSSWAIAAYFLYNYYRLKVLHQALIGTGFGTIDASLYNEKLLLALGITFAIIAFVLTIIILCSGRRIRLAVQIIKEAARALHAMPLIFVFPIFKYAVLLGVMAGFVWIFALLSTSGEIVASNLTYTIRNETAEMVEQHFPQGKAFNGTITMQYLQIYYGIGFLWTYNWIIAIAQCTMAGAVASWYWTRDKKTMTSFPLIRALSRVIRYHLGSMAIGSLLIALTQFIRILIFQAQKRVKASQNRAAQMVLGCLQCVFRVLEAFLKMLNKNAYIEIAVYGYSFFTAARMALEILTRNAFRLFVISKIGSFFIFLGKLAICFCTLLAGLGMMVYFNHQNEMAANYAVPLIVILIFSYITASGFMSVFQMAISTIFLSFCEDCERNNGSAERPYYMSDSLKAFTDKHKQEQPKV